MALQELTLELSLKPFLRRNAPPLREVCRELFSAWQPATQDARQISVLLWSGDGTEILEYSGDLQQQFDWGRYVGIMNRPLPAGTEQNDPLHRNAMIGHPFEPETEKTDYRFLAELVRELKAVGGELTGRPVRVGTAFDPGPEFTISAFKYRKHPEICRGSYGSHSRELVSCYSTLLADSGHYTGFPEGIPAGTPFGTFFGRQATCFLRDMGMEFLWLSNGFGFGNFPWSYTGVVFDGEQFHPEELETVRKQMLELFWKEFRKECSVPVFVRGTNLTTGRDLSCDGVPLKEIYDSGAIQAPPVNSPWAPLNYDFGSELIGWMSHAAGFPADDFTFRFYVCDPWFQTRPWLANYEGEPYDIYMPWAVSRLRKNGRIVTPNRINLVTVDDCRGQMPPETAEQIIPHLRQAQRNAPDAPGPFLWLYPFAEYHRWISQESGRIGEVFAGDHFLRDAVNNGLPLNTVMDTAECDQLPPGRVIVSPVPEEHTPWETRLLEYLESGGRILLYGPLEHSPRLRELLQIRLTAPLEGELELEGTDLPETFAPDRTIFHAPPYSAGGIRETGGKTVLAGCFRAGEHRALAAEHRQEGGGGTELLEQFSPVRRAQEPVRRLPAGTACRRPSGKWNLSRRIQPPGRTERGRRTTSPMSEESRKMERIVPAGFPGNLRDTQISREQQSLSFTQSFSTLKLLSGYPQFLPEEPKKMRPGNRTKSGKQIDIERFGKMDVQVMNSRSTAQFTARQLHTRPELGKPQKSSRNDKHAAMPFKTFEGCIHILNPIDLPDFTTDSDLFRNRQSCVQCVIIKEIQAVLKLNIKRECN